MMNRKDVSHCSGIPITVKDTIGAERSFTAAMIMGKLYNLPLEKINQLASKIAAYVCSQAGETPTLPAYLISELKQEIAIPIREILEIFQSRKIKKYNTRKADQPTL